ncbi:hypothetical protein AB4Z29_27375 [Paenibacillus sp. 2TAB23]|uniref:hypothetical protein n=1 Tax=Paenibacillus sp. 2TAB23 TaxID=3233004 RepID=UPI003F948EAC
MKKIVSVLCVLVLAVSLAACQSNEENAESAGTASNNPEATAPADISACTPENAQPVNGGFETGDLTGWTIVEGDAFIDDTVMTNPTFWKEKIPFKHEGNWHLYGLGFDETIKETKTGKLKSSTFTMCGDGKISMKIGAARDIDTTFVAVHLAENDEMIAKQSNTEFVDPGIADVSKYEAGLGFTNNYAEYTLDLSKYLGKEMYLMVVDGDDDGDFGFINLDDIRTYYVDGVAEPQAAGEKKDKARSYDCAQAAAPSPNEIANGGFEEGNLCGWTIEGDAFEHAGVTVDETWWAEKIPYNKDGKYLFGLFNEGGKGKLTSTTFELGGSGNISFKLGGGKDSSTMYISIIDADSKNEVARYGNSEFADVNFPNVDQGMRLANMVQYHADLSKHLGKNLYIEIVDQASSDWGFMTFDSFNTKLDAAPADSIEATNQLK